MPDWLHEEWANLDKREVLRLSLTEALKEHGTKADAETRRAVKAGEWVNFCHARTHVLSLGQIRPKGDNPNPGEGEEDHWPLVHGGEDAC